MITGHCNCGNVTFAVKSAAKGASICHCGQCRRQSGHQWASAYADKKDIEITGEIRWYAASPIAKRGFCPICGSFLFWHVEEQNILSFALGAIKNPTGITLEKHIFVADKGDYYDIVDGLPQKEQ